MSAACSVGRVPGQEGGALGLSSPRGRWVIFATVVGSGMAFVDATAVNVALPAIGRDFGAGLAGLQWTVTAYALTLSAFLLLGGSLGDRYGRRRLFVVGLAWFSLASLACGIAPGAGFLVAARALQGVGGALLTPGSLAIIEASFSPEERGRAIGAWSGLGGVFGAIGPLAGGFLVGAVSWRLVFFLNLPLAAVALLASRHVPESVRPGQRGPLDVGGPALAAVGLGGLTWALIEGPSRGWSSAAVLAVLGCGAAALGAFFLRESRAEDPLLPLGLFRNRELSGANGATFAVYGAFGAVTFLVVLQLQGVLHYSPLSSGLALMPLTLVLLAFSARSGRVAGITGPRLPMTIGPLVAAGGMVLFERVVPGSSYAGGVLPAALVFGVGLVITVPALTTTALGAVGPERSGLASAVNNDVARVASLAAVALVPALAGLPVTGAADPGAFTSGFRVAMLICAGLCASGGLVALLTVGGRPPPARCGRTSLACPVTGPPAAEPLEAAR